MYIPYKGFQSWAVIACDQYASDRNYWERVMQEVGNAPSARSFVLPGINLGDEGVEQRISMMHDDMFTALEEGWIHKLDRGFIYVERTTQSGTRKGILACIDLEEYSYEDGNEAGIRAAKRIVPSRLAICGTLREGAPLEFPHTMIFYRDKREKVMRMIDRDELEKLYDFDLMLKGGHIRGYFLPEDLSAELAHALMLRADPCFVVAEGNHFVAAAKAYWEKIKVKIPQDERRNHPARFTLAEFVNVYDGAVVLHPVHRLVKGASREEFCAYFMRSVKCVRKGNLLYPAFADGARGAETTDSLIAAYLKEKGGEVNYIHGEKALAAYAEQAENVGIVMKPIEKDDIFSAAKAGKLLPDNTFFVGEENEKRYSLEGREISYD